jgi:signal transduction histidine kinase
MQRLMEQLQRREIQTVKRRVRLIDVARQACERCAGRLPVPSCGGGDEALWVEADPERFAMIVEHVVRNAQDATPEDGSVTVSVTHEAGSGAAEAGGGNHVAGPCAVLTVTDTGAGMTQEFIQERLFKPFDTTKGSKGMGIGAYQVREYVQSLGGRVEVRSEPGRGTVMALKLPLAPSPAPAGEVAQRAGEGSLT